MYDRLAGCDMNSFFGIVFSFPLTLMSSLLSPVSLAHCFSLLSLTLLSDAQFGKFGGKKNPEALGDFLNKSVCVCVFMFPSLYTLLQM